MDDGGCEEETSDSDSSFGIMADGNRASAHNASNNVVDLTLGSGNTSSVCPTDDSNEDWHRYGGICLMQQNKYEILSGDKLNVLVINFVQKLLKKQFPFVKGLQSTLLQSKPPIQSHLMTTMLYVCKLFIAVMTTGLLHHLSTAVQVPRCKFMILCLTP